jgi:hypothetical protein
VVGLLHVRADDPPDVHTGGCWLLPGGPIPRSTRRRPSTRCRPSATCTTTGFGCRRRACLSR